MPFGGAIVGGLGGGMAGAGLGTAIGGETGRIIGGAVGGTLGRAAGFFLPFETGGRVPGVKGKPVRTLLHGQEYVLAANNPPSRKQIKITAKNKRKAKLVKAKSKKR